MKNSFIIALGLICSQASAQTELWGMTSDGGFYNGGTIFKTDGSGNSEQIKHNFYYIEGAAPFYGKITQASDGKFYGMTYLGGAYLNGVLFQYDPITSAYIKKLDFDGPIEGSRPKGSLVEASDGMLYGLTGTGGAYGLGVLFQYNPVTSTYVKKIDFNGTGNGDDPEGSLMQASDGMLYGVTKGGGVNSLGVIFRYDPTTSALIKIFDFDGTASGSNPVGELMQASDGNLYGMTEQGGANGEGVIFQLNPLTLAFSKKFDFAGATSGSYPFGTLFQASDGKLYGLTSSNRIPVTIIAL